MERDLTPEEFQRFRDLIYQVAGINYPKEKLELLSNRIRKRVRAVGAPIYDAYLQRLQRADDAERQPFLDAITTNETYFFRCQRHWDFFRQWLVQRQTDPTRRGQPLRIWSAAASNGSEAYTILIVLQQALGPGFGGLTVELLGTDLSSHVLDEARAGIYRPYALAQTPPEVVAKFFTRGERDQLEFDRGLRRHVRFQRHNLIEPLSVPQPFEFVFLRNVMIYFDTPSRERVLQNVFTVMRPGGHLIVGESESLLNTKHGFTYLKPSVFQKPAGQPVPGRA
jgi:chemotaxis protein methyltransferase CheR